MEEKRRSSVEIVVTYINISHVMRSDYVSVSVLFLDLRYRGVNVP